MAGDPVQIATGDVERHPAGLDLHGPRIDFHVEAARSQHRTPTDAGTPAIYDGYAGMQVSANPDASTRRAMAGISDVLDWAEYQVVQGAEGGSGPAALGLHPGTAARYLAARVALLPGRRPGSEPDPVGGARAAGRQPKRRQPPAGHVCVHAGALLASVSSSGRSTSWRTTWWCPRRSCRSPALAVRRRRCSSTVANGRPAC